MLTEFVRGRIVGIREGEFSSKKIQPEAKWHAIVVMRVSKEWTKDSQTGSESKGSVTA